MKNENTIEDSILYKQNMKIKNNIWKPVTITLLLSLMVIAVKGIV